MNAQDLKNSILQLAIQGKLVEQREEEGTAKELLEKIEAEKKQLIKEGKIKKQKALPEIKKDEIPFDIPESWEWIKIGEICNVINGFTPSKSNPKFWNSGSIPWFTIADVRSQGRFINYTEQSITKEAISKNSDRIVPKDSILLCCTASVGEYAYTNIALTTNQQFNGLVIKDEYKSVVHPMYVYEFVKTLKRTLLMQAGKTTINFVSVKKVSNIIIPLPPLEEQKRIVAKIEELMPFVDKYDVAYSEVEELNKKFPEDMQNSILQYAIQGKLVEQREEDGKAEDLYKQIQEEKQKMIKEGKIKKTKSLPEITEDEVPFDIPENWKWVRLGDVIHNWGQKKPNKTFDYIDVGSIDNINGMLSEEENLIDPKDAPSRARKIVKEGSVIYSTVRPYLLNICIINKEFEHEPIASTAFAILHPIKGIYNKYLYFILKSPMFISYVSSVMIGVAYPAINDTNLLAGLIPLPPLAEQKRIVEKIEELLPYTKQLIKKVD